MGDALRSPLAVGSLLMGDCALGTFDSDGFPSGKRVCRSGPQHFTNLPSRRVRAHREQCH
eukprot:15482012-Alexandrium_andersonii.AAC.1